MLLSGGTSLPVISTIPSTPIHLRRWGCCCHRLVRIPHASASPVLTKNAKPFVCSSLISAEEGNAGVDFKVLTAINSLYNDIVIIDTSESRMLLLDSTQNIHSVFMKGQTWTGSYWDEFASLPAIIPRGPIAIFGLGGGTAAHLMLTLWPSLQLDGWEIDEILIDKAREHLGLSDLEKHTEGGGILHVHIGDALSPSSTISGGYAGHKRERKREYKGEIPVALFGKTQQQYSVVSQRLNGWIVMIFGQRLHSISFYVLNGGYRFWRSGGRVFCC